MAGAGRTQIRGHDGGGPPAGARAERTDLLWALAVVVAMAVVLAIVSVWAYSSLGPVMGTRHRTPQALDPQMHWVQAWSWWDGEWYVDIARRGYYFVPHRMSSVAFFPVYPLLIRVVSPVVGSPVLAGVVVTLTCGIAASVMFYGWTHELFGRDTARRALGLLLVYPCSFYLFGAVYADAVFLLVAVSAFVLLEHDRPGWAGILGAVAAATRPVGIAVAVGLGVRALERRGLLSRAALRTPRRTLGELGADAGVLIAPLGLVAYCIYLRARFGDPFAFVSAEAGWRQRPGPRTWLKIAWFDRMARRPYLDAPHVHLVASALVTVLALGLAGLVFRRLGAGYGTFVVALLLGSAVSTSNFVGMGRYAMAAFPVFSVASERLGERPVLARTVLFGSAALLLVTTQLHARNMLIS